ncbi:hypothetical protein HLB44_09105 [Aquincola sp. S2]|uniref:Uncharacterized protein n=1 Tax=Pseudaquabacterium terrae TaxID=2732868 RepID=A0ABX2EEU7_9BURK|nr:hypothetical protein [Aquabacterium terrae]NRF67138.1 hypothetical protein [Aquabacterium terrae]
MTARFDGLRFSCVVDFLRVNVELPRTTQGWTLQEHVGAQYADPKDKGPGGAATKFLMTYNCPKSWSEVQASLDKISATYGLAREPQVAEMEVAFDAFDGVGNRERLGQLTHDFFRYTTHHPSHNKRLQPQYDKSDPATRRWPIGAEHKFAPEVNRLLKEGGTLYVGDDDEPVGQRYYLKTTDKGGDLKLRPSEWRARMEVTLRAMDGGLPFSTIEEARGFKFETLTKLGFRFRLPKDLPAVEHRMTSFARAIKPTRGLPGKFGRRKFDPELMADRELNEKARNALRGLTRRMS